MAVKTRKPFATRNVAQSLTVTSPIGGLNARDSLAAMPPGDAVTLDNFFPTPTAVDLRNGFTKQTISLPGNVESLLPYTSGTTKILRENFAELAQEYSSGLGYSRPSRRSG